MQLLKKWGWAACPNKCLKGDVYVKIKENLYKQTLDFTKA